jgi:hypothetical protein
MLLTDCGTAERSAILAGLPVTSVQPSAMWSSDRNRLTFHHALLEDRLSQDAIQPASRHNVLSSRTTQVCVCVRL